MPTGSIMCLTDHINFSGLNPLIGEPTDARFVPMKDAYDPGLRAQLTAAATATGTEMWISSVRRIPAMPCNSAAVARTAIAPGPSESTAALIRARRGTPSFACASMR